MRIPPYLVRWENGEPCLPGADALEDFDYRMLMQAPPEARRMLLDKRLEDTSTSDVCAWLDIESRKCRFHEFRPGICRDFEMGSDGCRLLRVTTLG